MTAKSTYTFKARDASGQVTSGTMVAASTQEVSERLREDGKFALAVHDKALRASTELDATQIRRNQAARNVKRDDVIAFCQQLSVMLETGVPIGEAIDAFHRLTPRREFKIVLEVIKDDIFGGEQLSVAMAKWPRVFPSMVISLMKASEASGTLGLMLGRVGTYLAKERRTAKQIRGALGYPMFMVMMSLLMTGFLVAFVLPRFAKIYEQRSASLPTPTRMLLGTSEFLLEYYLLYGPLLVGAVVGMLIWRRYPSGRHVIDWIKLHLPVIAPMYVQLNVTRAMRTMSTLLAAGVNLLDIIDICRGVTTNVYYQRMWTNMENGVREGNQLSDALIGTSLIPANVASMICSGERSGRLAEVTEKIAEFTEEELDAAVKTVTSFVEPIMIIVMGLVVGGIALALLLPVFSMGKIMTGSG